MFCVSIIHRHALNRGIAFYLAFKVAPICNDPPNHQYFIGINQTITIECRVKNSNPNYVRYSWYFNSDMMSYKHAQQQNVQNTVINEGFVSRIKLTPTSVYDFGSIKCLVSNDIGTNECTYELKLGGKCCLASSILLIFSYQSLGF
jgi:hypothetical protein